MNVIEALPYIKNEFIKIIAKRLSISEWEWKTYNELYEEINLTHPELIKLYESYIQALIRFEEKITEGVIPKWHNERKEIREKLISELNKAC